MFICSETRRRMGVPCSPQGEDDSLYEPPDTVEPALSEGYESFGDTDTLESVGDLLQDVFEGVEDLAEEDLYDYPLAVDPST